MLIRQVAAADGSTGAVEKDLANFKVLAISFVFAVFIVSLFPSSRRE